MVNNNLFVLVGDWNVSLNVEDRSAGGSCKTTDMEDFQKCIEDIICTVVKKLKALKDHMKQLRWKEGNLYESYNLGSPFLGTSEPVQQFDTSNLRPVAKVTLKEDHKALHLNSSKKAWSVVGNDVCSAINEFFHSGKVLKKIREYKKFRYHWGCKEMEISSLCFADDLLVLSHEDVQSTTVIKEAMDLLATFHVLIQTWERALFSLKILMSM
ncbi:hypothetical protein Tco_1024753 [Tanacetum coccineum]